MLLSPEEYRILNSCADDVETFYIIFAELNYGGQVFPRSSGTGYARYDDEGPWVIKYSGADIAGTLRELIASGFIACWRVSEDPDGRIEQLDRVDRDEFLLYLAYDCRTLDDHLETYGYGPHEFKTTNVGLAEIKKDEYQIYDEALGWS